MEGRIRRMTRAHAALCASILAAAGTASSAQVPLPKEPRHKQVLYTANMRVLDVGIPVGDTTLDHIHDMDVATVSVADSTTRVREMGKDWGAPRERPVGNLSISNYTGARQVHRIENIGKTPYRVIAVENDRESGWTTPAAITAPGTKLAQESRAFSVYEVRLDAATSRTTHMHEVPTLVVLVSGAMTYQGGGGNDPFTVNEPGKWVFGPRGSGHTLTVGAGETAHIIEFEAR